MQEKNEARGHQTNKKKTLGKLGGENAVEANSTSHPNVDHDRFVGRPRRTAERKSRHRCKVIESRQDRPAVR